MDDLAYVERLLPLSDYERVRGEQQRGDIEIGYAERAACEVMSAASQGTDCDALTCSKGGGCDANCLRQANR